MNAYPLSRYEIDQHVDAGLTNLSGTVDAIPHALAAIIWAIDRHLASWAIQLFTAAFNVDLLSDRAPLRAAASATATQLYTNLATPLLTCAILACGLWAIWQLLIQRHYTDGIAHLAASVAYCIACLAIVLAPSATIGTLASTAHDLSATILAATLPGSTTTATTKATDGLRTSLIDEPWLQLEFGATTYCLNTTGDDVAPLTIKRDGTPIPPSGAHCINTHTLADSFLSHDPGSDPRKHAFDQLNNSDDPLRKRSVRIQTAAAGYDRVAIALGLLVAAIGAVVLIGGLSLGMIAAQLYALVLIACAPIAFLASFIPGQGHHIVRVWGGQLVAAIFRSCIYCLYLTLATALSLAILTTVPTVGSVGALTLQATLWWGLIIFGHRLSKRLAERTVAAPAVRATTDTARSVTRRTIRRYTSSSRRPA